MSLEEVACQISELLENNRAIFVYTEPEVPDFTINASFKIIVCGSDDRVEIEVSRSNLFLVIGQLDATIFDKTHVDRLYTWNIKSLATYFHYTHRATFSTPDCPAAPRFIAPTNSIIDIKVIENFLAIRKNRPENLIEAVNRTKLLVKYAGWQTVYKAIHLPLSLKVLPSIEATPLLDETGKRPVHPYYEIEGQINGRMNCYKKYTKNYTPHTMGPDVRSSLKPRGYGYRFVCSDFRHCEVTVLQWLSGDPKLKEIIDSGDDLHKRIYELLTGDQCNSDTKRKISKKLFLPVMYGLGPATLAKDVGIKEELAGKLIERIKTNFNTAWNWMYQRQEQARSGPISDYFNRPRQFDPERAYLARNFSVQGVAATVCEEKLIDLHKEVNGVDAYLAFSVHDGYGLVCKVAAAKETFQTIKRVCEAESKLCPGLLMKVEVKFGANLNEMKVLWK